MNHHSLDVPEAVPVKEKDQVRLWSSFTAAVGTELRPATTIRGVSGLDHPVQAISVDDKNKRVLIISAEQNARVAALMQGDVQATMTDVRVLVARPVVVDLGIIARQVFKDVEGARINLLEFKDQMERIQKLDPARSQRHLNRRLKKAAQPALLALRNVTLPTLNQLMDVLQQAAHLDWSYIFESVKDGQENPSISFEKLLNIDNMAIDRQHGVCPVPLYEFTADDWEMFFRGDQVEHVRQRLRELDIYQYFFPAPDQVVMGAADKGLTDRGDIIEFVQGCQPLGHPLGDSEIVPQYTRLPELIESLTDLGYLAEGEHGVEITPAGRTTRMLLKYRPRESLISKLINRFTVNGCESTLGRPTTSMHAAPSAQPIQALGAPMSGKKNKVFISYSHKDRNFAEAVYSLLAGQQLDVWLDVHRLKPGQSLSSQIEAGLSDSDYYILVISENSNTSNWVKREVATAIELADKKKLAVIPVIIDGAPVPFEFKGLLYIDATASLNHGLARLADYFGLEDKSTRQIEGGVVIRKGGDDSMAMMNRCQLILGELKTRDLRHHITTRLTLEDVKVIWFDLFETRMTDDAQIQNLALSCVELIARCDREDQRRALIEILCRNHPRIAATVKPQ